MKFTKPLASSWSFSFFSKKQSNNSAEHYEDNIHLLGKVNSVEGFWSIYSHIQRPNNLENGTDYHLFRDDIQPIWEHPENRDGGKWIIRLKKGLASYYWEKLIVALISEQFPIDVNGAVVSIRYGEDLISLWNKTGKSKSVIHEICRDICLALELPPDTKLEYKKHDDSVKDGSSFKNTVIYQAGTDEPFEISNGKSPDSNQGKGADSKH